MKRNELFDKLSARIPLETIDRVEKLMTCAYYTNGGDCSKGLPGTPCELKRCVAWRLADWAKEKEQA